MKILIGAAVVAAGGLVGVLTTANLRLSSRVEELEGRLVQIEHQRAEAAGRGRDAGKVGVTSRTAEPIAPNGAMAEDLAKQVAALRSSVEELQKSGAAGGGSSPAGLAIPGADAPGAAPVPLAEGQRKQLEQVVADVLQKREEDREKERQARMDEMAKERVNNVLDQLTAELALSAAQRDAIAPLLAGAMKQIGDLMQGRRDTGQRDAMGNVIIQQDVSRQNMREEMGKILADADTKVKTQLTAEQGTKYDEWRKANPVGPGMMVRFPGGGGAGAPGGGRAPVNIEIGR